MFKRIFLIVLDGMGIGQAPDASEYNSENANTLKHTIGDSYNLDVLEKIGLTELLNIHEEGVRGIYMKACPKNKMNDSLNGHYELMGALANKNFLTYPDGFPMELINEIERISQKDVIGNIKSDGIEIINELGEMHIKTGALIVYTSKDSVLQIAAHEDIVSVEKLYEICEKVSKIACGEKYKIGRVIARPFTGKIGKFARISKRKDYALDPPKNVIDLLFENNINTITIGKIGEMFNNKNISYSIKTHDNIDAMLKIVDFAKGNFNGLLFANLNDFDEIYGHRRDKSGYLKCLEEFNYYLPILLKNLNKDDLLIITSDHGNDPTYKGNDHTREYVPILLYSHIFKKGRKLDDRDTLADIGATILDNFNIKNTLNFGNSIFDKFKK